MRRRSALLLAFGALTACSVLTTLDDLRPSTDGGPGTDAGADTNSVADSPPDIVGVDSSNDGTAKYSFVDDFERPDTNGGVGNGWVAKGNTFLIHTGVAERVVNDANEYFDNIQTRPSGESVGDVEVSVELRLTSLTACSPQIHARVIPGTVNLPGSLDSYLLYLDNDGTYANWAVARQRGTATSVTLDKLIASAPLDITTWFRITLKVVGANPVTLSASIEKRNGVSWSMLAAHTLTDSTPLRLDLPGVVGFGAGKGTGYETTGQYAYDNFMAIGR